MKNNAVVIAGYYGFGNAGDELILRSLIDQYRQEDPSCRVTVMSVSPEMTSRHFGVEAINRWKPWSWIVPLARSRQFVLGGGGLLQESTGPWNHAYYLFLIMLAKLLGCHTEVRSVGVDPIGWWFNEWLTRWVFNSFVDRVSVRDADSQRALETAGVHGAIYRASDLVFQLTVPSSQKNTSKLALCVAPWPQRPGWEHDVSLLCSRLTDYLQVSIDFLVFFPEEDDALVQKAATLCAPPAGVRRWSAPEDLLGWVSEYDLVIGMRYHALVLAALAEKPFIGWGFQKKVWSLCRDFGQPSWSFERGWEEDAVFRQICEAWRHRDILPQRYRSRLPQLKSPEAARKEIPRIHPARV